MENIDNMNKHWEDEFISINDNYNRDIILVENSISDKETISAKNFAIEFRNLNLKSSELTDILIGINADYKLININKNYLFDGIGDDKFSIDIDEGKAKFDYLYCELIRLTNSFIADKDELSRNMEIRDFKSKQDEINRKNKEEQEIRDKEEKIKTETKINNTRRLLSSVVLIFIDFYIMKNMTLNNRVPLSIIGSLLCISGIVLGVRAINIKYKKICIAAIIINVLLLVFNIYLGTALA